jgi:hypothetical protein
MARDQVFVFVLNHGERQLIDLLATHMGCTRSAAVRSCVIQAAAAYSLAADSIRIAPPSGEGEKRNVTER